MSSLKEENESESDYSSTSPYSSSSSLDRSTHLNGLSENDPEFQSLLHKYSNLKSSEKSLNPAALKYLYKLLKFYKLDHYMTDLIELGYTTPYALNSLALNHFESVVSVSPYDKKKFQKLTQFIKQTVKSIGRHHNTISSNSNRISRESNCLNEKIDSHLVNESTKSSSMLKKDSLALAGAKQSLFVKNPNLNNPKTKRTLVPGSTGSASSRPSTKLSTNGRQTLQNK
jgi:hypothetical protein